MFDLKKARKEGRARTAHKKLYVELLRFNVNNKDEGQDIKFPILGIATCADGWQRPYLFAECGICRTDSMMNLET